MAPRDTKNSSVRMTRSGQVRIGAEPVDGAFRLDHLPSIAEGAGLTGGRIGVSLAAARAEHGPDHVGDDIAGALDDHAVALPDIEGGHLFVIVQAGVGYGYAADEDRFELRRRRHACPCARRRW